MSVTVPELWALVARVEKGDLKARLALKEHLVTLVREGIKDAQRLDWLLDNIDGQSVWIRKGNTTYSMSLSRETIDAARTEHVIA